MGFSALFFLARFLRCTTSTYSTSGLQLLSLGFLGYWTKNKTRKMYFFREKLKIKDISLTFPLEQVTKSIFSPSTYTFKHKHCVNQAIEQLPYPLKMDRTKISFLCLFSSKHVFFLLIAKRKLLIIIPFIWNCPEGGWLVALTSSMLLVNGSWTMLLMDEIQRSSAKRQITLRGITFMYLFWLTKNQMYKYLLSMHLQSIEEHDGTNWWTFHETYWQGHSCCSYSSMGY